MVLFALFRGQAKAPVIYDRLSRQALGGRVSDHTDPAHRPDQPDRPNRSVGRPVRLSVRLPHRHPCCLGGELSRVAKDQGAAVHQTGNLRSPCDHC